MWQDLRGKHKIAHNGYNIGRDLIVEKATSGSSYLNRRYEARVDWVEGLLPPGNEGECFRSRCARDPRPPPAHYLRKQARGDIDRLQRLVGMAHGISQDGRVAVLTVHEFWLYVQSLSIHLSLQYRGSR